MHLTVAGIDFTSSPSRLKPIKVSVGSWKDEVLSIATVSNFSDDLSLDGNLRDSKADLVGIDAPFGIPVRVAEAIGLPSKRGEFMAEVAAMSKVEFIARLQAFADSQPYGSKEPRRRTEKFAKGSFSSVKLGRPSMARMTYEAICLLHRINQSNVIEVFPGLVARLLVGKTSYKGNTSEHRATRALMVERLDSRPVYDAYGMTVDVGPFEVELIEDTEGDALDAVFACLQTAWASRLPDPFIGFKVEPFEGWIMDPKIFADLMG